MAGKRIQLTNSKSANTIIIKIQKAYQLKHGFICSRAKAINIALNYFDKKAFRKINKKDQK